MRAEANRWRDRGWSTVNLTYRACGQSVADALWFYDRARAMSGPQVPVCTTGMSAGGHLALSIAAMRPDTSCAVAQGAPSDLAALLVQTAFDGATLGQQGVGPTKVYWWSVAAFGLLDLGVRSPALAPIRARVLAATAERDPLIPAGQDAGLAAKLRARDSSAYVDTMRLATGPERFTHATVARTELEAFWQRELALVEPLVAGAPSHALPVRMSTDGSTVNGSMQLEARATASTATVTAGSTVVHLAAGHRYRIDTCVAWYSEVAPRTTCRGSDVIDTTSAAGGAWALAPVVVADHVRSTIRENFVMGLVTVSRQAPDGSWQRIGSSWPATGLSGAGLTLDPAT
jgi:dienelactone hydrolase